MSFADSLKQARVSTEESDISTESINSVSESADDVMVMSLETEESTSDDMEDTNVSDNNLDSDSDALLNNDSNDNPKIITYGASSDWVKSGSYLWYDEYEDENISTVNCEDKTITVNSNQINLTQEANSQYIPFVMDRYYDGVDLTSKNLLIHYVNPDGDEEFVSPINVSYSEDQIKFAWLVSSNVTAISGEVEFEIQAIGITSKGDDYIWKTKPNGKLNIIESLSGNGIIEPDSTWLVSFLTQVTDQVSLAQTAANEATAAISEVNTALEEINTVVDTAKTELTETVDTAIAAELGNYYTKTEVDTTVTTAITTELESYYTKTEVDELLESIDISDSLQDVYNTINDIDGLANFGVQYDADTSILSFYNGETLITSVDLKIDSKIETAINDNLSNYYSSTEVDNLLDNKADASTVNSLATQVSTVESTANANATNIETVSTKVGELEESINNIDTDPSLTYDVSYETESGLFTFYEIEGDGEASTDNIKQQFTITGGSGGSSTSTTISIERITTTPLVVITGNSAVIEYNFTSVDSSGDDTGDGTAVWKVGSTTVATTIALQGYNSFDVTNYISTGTQKVTLTITDAAGAISVKYWTVQVIDVRLDTKFDDSYTYTGNISFTYTPYGAIEKTVHFILDGVEIGTVVTSVSGLPLSYTLPAQEHGSHLLEVYITAEVNGSTIETDHIYKDIIWYDADSDIPVIGCIYQEFTALQYDSTSIVYTVYDPDTETPTVTLAVDGEIVSILTLESATNTWQYKSTEVGEHILTITCGVTVKTIVVTIEELDIDVSPVTAGLVFDFDPTGYSNNDSDKLWSSDDGTVAMTVSDNFDWINGGYQIDDDGDTYFCIKAGTTATIDYKLFEDDAKKNGKEFKLIFMTENVSDASATFLTCVTGSDSNKIGIEMNVHEAYIYASAESLYLPYSEEDIIEFEFNINKDTNTIPMVMGYEDGVGTRPMIYSSSHDFTQTDPQDIVIGSENCDIRIYRFKVYNEELTDTGILNNFIADARNADEMIDRYNRNQIYDENNELTPEALAEKCPQLRIIKIDAPHFTNNKSDKVTGTTIQYIYGDGDAVLDNWTAYNCQHSGQGTTSNEYGAAGRNLDLIMNKSGVDGVSPYIVLGDGSEVKKVSLTRDSVEVNYFNVKVNIASSENANNALLQKRYNTYNPYLRPARVNDSTVKDTMEFFNCVVFIRENDTDTSTHREFDDCDWHFYAIGNIGDSKKTDSTRLNDPDDPLECIVEIMDNTLYNSTFDGDSEALAHLEEDPFDESMTYGWRYIYDEDDETVTSACMDAWKTFYKFVVNSTDTEFKANLSDYFVVDSALYFYLFTTRYTLIDNRAKNTFWHYGKCDDGVYRWDLCFDYDNDYKNFCRCKTFSNLRRKPEMDG